MILSVLIHGALLAFVAYTTLDMALPEGHVEVDFSPPPEGEQIHHQGPENTIPVPKFSGAKKKPVAKKPPKKKPVKKAPPPKEEPSPESISLPENKPDKISDKDTKAVEVKKPEPKTEESPEAKVEETETISEEVPTAVVEKAEPAPEVKTPSEEEADKTASEDVQATEVEKAEPETEKHSEDKTDNNEKSSESKVSPDISDKVTSKDINMEEAKNEEIENLAPPQDIAGAQTSPDEESGLGTDETDLSAAPIMSTLPYGVPGGDPNQKAVPVSGNPQPRYPFILRWKKVEGVVRTLVSVSPTGRVTDIKVMQSSHDNFTQETLKVLRHWKFQPNGRQYKTIVPFRFKLEGEAKNIEFNESQVP